MLPILPIAGAAQGLAKAGFGIAQMAQAKKIKPVFSEYGVSQFAKNQLSTAQNFMNSRMAGAAEQAQGIQAAQGNAMGAAARNAGSGSQLLAANAAAQGVTNQSVAGLGIQEAQNKFGMLANLNQAYNAMINEGDKVQANRMAKWQADQARKDALQAGGAQNLFGGIGDAASAWSFAPKKLGGVMDNDPSSPKGQYGKMAGILAGLKFI